METFLYLVVNHNSNEHCWMIQGVEISGVIFVLCILKVTVIYSFIRGDVIGTICSLTNVFNVISMD